MKLSHFLSAQFDRELPISRRILARVPADRSDWRPHPKSMPLQYLGTLVATMPSWIAMAITREELDVHPKEGSGIQPPPWNSTAELLEQFESAAAQAQQALSGTSDEHLATTWKLLASGKVVDERARREVIADTLCHAAHHRGQLSVYLRMLEVPIPSIYGPSADDRVF